MSGQLLTRVARRLRVRGVVQGVGFRPFVHRLATRYGLAGWVRNGSGDVEIEIEGEAAAADGFTRCLRDMAPSLARIESIDVEAIAHRGRETFSVLPSESREDQRLPLPPDVGMCPACAAELEDPGNRRYQYPFITCTDCGPRYTVIESLPYDRERTTMRVFAQCEECHREYITPGDRRFHSETNSCPRCGPRLWFQANDAVRAQVDGGDALTAAAALLTGGGVVALRGVGGFHLAVDATNDGAVRRLRLRKQRDAKPFAIMVRTVEQARAIVTLSPEEERLLAAPERPIVLLERRAESAISDEVAPGLDNLGVMLPATPLHHLLLRLVDRPLVMTSGNVSDEPIASTIADALERLAPVADGYLLHDREIVARCDDSVLKLAAGHPRFLRRARGFAPLPLRLPVASPEPLVAVGPHLKNTFTLVHGDVAWISPHVGDLENLETLDHFQAMLERFEQVFRIRPRVAVRDLHPGYLSTRIAEGMDCKRVLAVQHHHAHVAAVMAEHGVTEPVVGISFDGTGYGSDGRVWGAEVFRADLTGFQRLGHLRYVPLPGGDLAARMPWRSALGYLSLAPRAAEVFESALDGVTVGEREAAMWQIANRFNAPEASSMGRLFDAAAAILGVRRVSAYEGQAAMELEALAGRRPAREIPGILSEENGVLVLDPLPVLIRLGLARQRGADIADLAADFHASIAWNAARMVDVSVEQSGLSTVVLSGGVFQNARLLWSLTTRLEEQGLRVLSPRQLGANDGAISYGQAAIAAAQLQRESGRG